MITTNDIVRAIKDVQLYITTKPIIMNKHYVNRIIGQTLFIFTIKFDANYSYQLCIHVSMIVHNKNNEVIILETRSLVTNDVLLTAEQHAHRSVFLELSIALLLINIQHSEDIAFWMKIFVECMQNKCELCRIDSGIKQSYCNYCGELKLRSYGDCSVCSGSNEQTHCIDCGKRIDKLYLQYLT